MPDIPEWAYVWYWLRFTRAPQVMKPLPQQEPDPEQMTREEYRGYRSEWVEAGSPRHADKLIVALTGGNPLLERNPLLDD